MPATTGVRVIRQKDGTNTDAPTDFASQNGDYLGWIAVSDGNGSGDNIQAIRQQNGFKAYACDGRIVVEGAEGHYTVHAVSGQQVSATAHLSRGIYIVKCGAQTAKVLVP